MKDVPEVFAFLAEDDRLLYLFREFLWIEEEGAVEGYIDDVLLQAGATQDEIKFIKGEVA